MTNLHRLKTLPLRYCRDHFRAIASLCKERVKVITTFTVIATDMAKNVAGIAAEVARLQTRR